jgi:FkbM family methyltransferase
MFSTKSKIKIANILSKMAISIVGRHKTVYRNGILWELDLVEAIDLSIYFFGRYQPHIIRQIKSVVPLAGGVVVDVGANVGAISLSLLKELPGATVLAFEPTDWAFNKLQKNLSLNPELKARSRTFQMFLNDGKKAAPEAVYASWDLTQVGETHVSHGGSLKSASGATSACLDDVIQSHNLTAVHFIKIDTDGHEWDVLQGAKKTLLKYRPTVLFEAGIDLWQEKGLQFSDFEKYFHDLGYEIRFKGKLLTPRNANAIIPLERTVDLIALPKK